MPESAGLRPPVGACSVCRGPTLLALRWPEVNSGHEPEQLRCAPRADLVGERDDASAVVREHDHDR